MSKKRDDGTRAKENVKMAPPPPRDDKTPEPEKQQPKK
jgi:hypothetical protein